MSTNQNKQIFFLHYLRIFAAFAVVLLHTSAPLLKKMEEGETVIFLKGNLFDSATRWCVPIFFMISGALLLSSKKGFDLARFFKSRFNRILLPFLAFSLFYYLVNYGRFDLIQFIIKLANNKIAGHLWFFYAFIAVYLFSPLLIFFVKQSSETLNLFIVMIWFLFNSLFPFLNGMVPDLEINFYKAFGTYFGYFFLGYVLYQIPFSRKTLPYFYILGGISLFITFFGTYVFTLKQQGEFFPIFYTYNSPNVLMMAVSIFLFFKYNLDFKFIKMSFFTKMSSLTFGVYLIHPYILSTFIKHNHLNFFNKGDLLITIPLISLTVFIISMLLAWFISIIPILKKII